MSTGSRIHNVGHYLQKEAVSANSDDRDAFARSAFNRYYYGAFLNTRALLGSLDPSWLSMSHSGYPEVLKGKVRKKLNQAREKARKNGDSTLVSRIDTAKRAVDELAKIMTIAYAIRVVADYEPDEPVNFVGSLRFSLRSIDISDAHAWENGSRMLCSSVERVWNEIRE